MLRLPVGGLRGLEAALPEALANAGAGRAERLVCVTAPGSITGIRAALAALLGVAAVTRAPLHGCGSLEAIALGAPDGEVTVVRDAGRGGVHVARFARWGTWLTLLDGPVRVVHESLVLEPSARVVRRGDDVAALGDDAAVVAALAHSATLPPLDLAGVDPATGRGAEPGL